MKKAELALRISEKLGTMPTDAERFIDVFTESIKETLKNGEKIVISGFGTFKTRHQKEYIGRNPQTKEPVKVTASDIPTFKASEIFKNDLK